MVSHAQFRALHTDPKMWSSGGDLLAHRLEVVPEMKEIQFNNISYIAGWYRKWNERATSLDLQTKTNEGTAAVGLSSFSMSPQPYHFCCFCREKGRVLGLLL
jgi:hypothetical protein